VHVSEQLMVSRVEMRRRQPPVYVFEVHFPQSTDAGGHKAMWAIVEPLVLEYKELGHVVLMGDFNAHTKANGDKTEDTAGRRFLRKMATLGLHVVNNMAACSGTYTRIVYGSDGSETGTSIDYCCVSDGLVGRVKSLLLGPQLGSDHRLMTLRLAGIEAEAETTSTVWEVWRTELLPDWKKKKQTSDFVATYQQVFGRFIGNARTQIAAMEAVSVEARRIADIVEWSFQKALDEGSSIEMSTKLLGPKHTPMLNAAMRLLNGQRKTCEYNLKRVMANGASTGAERAQAVRLYRDAKAALFTATRKRKHDVSQRLFRQVEERQADSKLFWSHTKRVTAGLKAGISPPPLVRDSKGKVQSDPVEVLKAWRRFCAGIASSTPEEEGIYDDEYKEAVEARLEELREHQIHQPELDRPITSKEVFAAIRRMGMGKAPGVDGVLSSILKHAADAVGTNTFKGGNATVEALTLMFNYVFDKEVWPERWGSGVIFPLYKEDDRLEPGNYRPITLLSVVGKLFGLVVEKRLSDWSERTGAISDEQGGFRRARGTPDQIFLLREIITYRKEKGLATLVTYIDARKAYDTVWREGNYVRLFDLGVQGKMWRQIQAMGANMRSKVRLKAGETDWHDVLRGVAQGAVE